MFTADKIPTYIFTVGGICRYFFTAMNEDKKEEEFLQSFLVLCLIAYVLARVSSKKYKDNHEDAEE